MQKNNTIIKRSFAVLLSLLLLLAAAPLAFAEDEGATADIYVDFCEGHGELAEMLAAYLETEADGAVVPVTLTLQDGDVTSAIRGVEMLLIMSGIMDSLGASDELQIHNGEQYNGVGLKELSAYADEAEYNAERNSHWETEINDGDTLFIHWKKPAQNVTVTIDAPVCGTVVEWANDSHDGSYPGNNPHTHPSPKITVTGDAVLFHTPYHGGDYSDGVYVDNAEGNMAYSSIDKSGYFQGTIEGGENYYVTFILRAVFGFYIADSTTILINGEAPAHRSPLVASVAAVHAEPDDGISVITPATCAAPGLASYVCPNCGEVVEVEIPAAGHDWSAPVWNWNEDGSAASATFTCANGDHPETVEAAVSPVESAAQSATCTSDGSNTYSASVTFEGETYTDEKVVVIPAAGHDYETEWIWSNDFSLAVLTLNCRACDFDTACIAAITEEKTDPTATEDGAIVYTAGVTVNGETYTDTKTVVLPAAGTPNETDDLCKWCGETHTGVFGGIVGFFHTILYFFSHLFGAR